MKNEQQLLACVETLKRNTNEARDTLYNGSTLEVKVAMTLLKQKGSEGHLKLYTDWLDAIEDVKQECSHQKYKGEIDEKR